MSKDLEASIAEVLPRVVRLRHELHAHPELSYRETYTSSLIQRELAAAGVELACGLAETGVVGWLTPRDASAAARKAIALRADMDALPIAEQTGKEYASQNPGCMHACGHDGHAAILLGAAMVLAARREALRRPVKLFFQPAEEGGAGARRLIEAGAMTEKVGGCEVGAVFGLHGYPSLSLGEVGVRCGPVKARVDAFTVTVEGRGGHGARPHETNDPIVAAAHLVVATQTVVSRNLFPLEPAVVSFGSIHAGSASNIIPQRVELQGTIRTFRDETSALIQTRIRDIAAGVAEALGCRAAVEFSEGYPVAVNDPVAAEYVRKVAGFLGADKVIETAPTMGSEDFAYYGQLVPSCQAALGCRPAGAEDVPNLHSPTYDFNDEALPIGIRLFCELAIRAEELAID